jgi:hypothetical protein
MQKVATDEEALDVQVKSDDAQGLLVDDEATRRVERLLDLFHQVCTRRADTHNPLRPGGRTSTGKKCRLGDPNQSHGDAEYVQQVSTGKLL